jgi:hypothetical protein
LKVQVTIGISSSGVGMVDVTHILPFCDTAGTQVTVSVEFLVTGSDSDHASHLWQLDDADNVNRVFVIQPLTFAAMLWTLNPCRWTQEPLAQKCSNTSHPHEQHPRLECCKNLKIYQMQHFSDFQ